MPAAFAGHNVPLGSPSVLLPKAGLAGAAPKTGKTAAKLSPATMKDIRQRIGASEGAKFSVTPITLGAERAVEVVHQRVVPLSGLSKELKGVVAIAPETLVVDRSGHAAAAFSAMPDESTTTDEVTKFVETLLAHGQIDFSGEKTVKPKSSLALGAVEVVGKATPHKLTSLPTHRIVTKGGKKILVRIRFICR